MPAGTKCTSVFLAGEAICKDEFFITQSEVFIAGVGLSGLSGEAIRQLEQQGENENATAGQKNHPLNPQNLSCRSCRQGHTRSRGAKNGTTAEPEVGCVCFFRTPITLPLLCAAPSPAGVSASC